jgi:hypothetical protein
VLFARNVDAAIQKSKFGGGIINGVGTARKEVHADTYSAVFQHDFAINSEKNDERNERMWLPFK